MGAQHLVVCTPAPREDLSVPGDGVLMWATMLKYTTLLCVIQSQLGQAIPSGMWKDVSHSATLLCVIQSDDKITIP